jgi:L-ribulose-5-phosphate 4-epimerase
MVDDPRHDVWHHARKMWEAGLVVASSGNVSRRAPDGRIAITPTSIPYQAMQPDDVVLVDLETGRAVDSFREASYELPLHLGIYRQRADIAAIVHTHAPFITTLSVLRRPLPPIIDEMMVHFGGAVEVADYAFTGTDDLAHNVLRILGDRPGVMLANHGNVCVGRSLDRALHVALAMEAAARVYVQALAIGEPVTLPAEAIEAGRRMFEER